MKAYDIAGKRRGMRIEQADLARALGWDVRTLRDIERGDVDISPEQYEQIIATLNAMNAEKTQRKEVIPA